jgi:hypothetical protein
MGVVARLTGRGDPLAEIEKEIAKHAREVTQAGTDLATAKASRDELLSSGASDDECDAAGRTVVHAERRVVRAEIRRAALSAERATLAAQARADLERRLVSLALAAGAAHAKNARASAQTAAEYLARKFELENAGFRLSSGELPSLVHNVVDLSNSIGPNAVAQSVHPLVERFAFDLETLARKISA